MSVEDGNKPLIRDFWNKESCGTQFSDNQKHTRDYYDDIEAHRYRVDPEVFSFAQFTRYSGCRILEVGVGAGTDFVQWIRAGARASGIDLTQEAITHVKRRLDTYGLSAEDVRVADCEALPYPDDSFDLVYSWGVIHHTPDTTKALREIIRVCRPGGTCKIMIYHRRSLAAFFHWFRYALLVGRPWRTISWCLYHRMESVGTKAYTKREIRDMLADQMVESLEVRTQLSYYDRLGYLTGFKGPLGRLIARACAWFLGGDAVGWFLMVDFKKARSGPSVNVAPVTAPPPGAP